MSLTPIKFPEASDGAVSSLAYYKTAYVNPLTEALPRLSYDDSILEKLSTPCVLPDQEVRAQPVGDRMIYSGQILRVHFALNRDRELAQTIDGMIRDGYVERGSVARQRALTAQRTEELVRTTATAHTQEAALQQLVTKSCGMHHASETRALIGMPGTGKTCTLHRVCNLYPEKILFPATEDPRLPPMQVPTLIVEAPADRTIASFHGAVVRALEQRAGEEVKARMKRGNRSERIATVAELLQHYHVGLLAIDEIQKLIRQNGAPDYILLNFILEIANTLRVPVLFVGTPAARKLLANELRNARRMLGRSWTNYGRDSQEWSRLVTGIWPYQFTAEYTPLSDEIRAVLYEETLGLPGLLTRLLRDTQRMLMLANAQSSPGSPGIPEQIRPALLQSVANAILGPVRPMLNALRSGSLDEAACFDDLLCDDSDSEARLGELADYRRRDFERTIRTVRREGTKQRRRAKTELRLEVDALVGSLKAADALAVAEPRNPTATTASATPSSS